MAHPDDAITRSPGGRILTNCNVWSPCGAWIVYDTRSDPAGSLFDGVRIEAVHFRTGEVRSLYESSHGACCGVATWHPSLMQVVFILGPEHPTPDWCYGPSHRQGVTLDFDHPGITTNLDARDLSGTTAGALRGGSHVHVWHPHGDLLSFTYEDAVTNDGLRTVGICDRSQPVTVPNTHQRNHDGSAYSVLVPHVTTEPVPGSDDVCRACEESWVGTSRTLAFQGTVTESDGRRVAEVFVVDVPERIPSVSRTESGNSAPCPVGINQRRLTRGGISGPRHWLRSDPAGARIGFLRPDSAGVVQFWTVSLGGEVQQVTRLPTDVWSAFTWHPNGRHVAFVSGTQVFLCDTHSGAVQPLTPLCHPEHAPRPEACVLSPDGRRVAFVRQIAGINQICVAEVNL